MPANNYSLVANWESDTGGTGPTTSPSGGELTVTIGFERCSATNASPPFQSAGTAINCFAKFSWFFTDPQTMATTPTTVQFFTQGDVSFLTEDDPAVEDRIRLGHANRAGVAVGNMRGGANGVYYLPLTLNPNSAGTISVTVLSLAAATIPIIGSGDQPVYGPFAPATASFGYSSLSGTVPTQTKPEVEIITPPDLVYSGGTATITLQWDSDIRQLDEDFETGNGADDDIRISAGTYVANSFTHVSNTMTFQITLDGSGTETIRVKADAFTDTAGDTGPPQDTSESFQYDTTRSTSSSDTGTNVETIYDSGNRAHNFTTDPVLGPLAGGFAGVSDLRVIGSNIYCTVQMQNRVENMNELADSEARAVLLRIPNRTGSTAAVLKRYDRITQAARSPVLWNNRIYVTEGSYLPGGSGNVLSWGHTGTMPQNHGTPWRSRLNNPNALSRSELISYGVHSQFPCRTVAIGQNLYGVAGYGAARSAKSTDWASSENPEGRDEESTRWDNWTVFRLGSTFDFRVPALITNDVTAYDIIKQLAVLSFCYVSLNNNTFEFRPKAQIEGRLATSSIDSGDSVSELNYMAANRIFPVSGTVLVHGQNRHELMTYTGRNSDNNQLTGVSRAQEGTSADDLCRDARIRYVDHIINMPDARHNEGSITQLTVRQDLRQLYNIIKVHYGQQDIDNPAIARNEISIAENKPRELELTIPLDYHYAAWAQWLADEYLRFQGTPQSLIEIQLKPSFYITVGQFIYLREPLNSRIDGSVYQVLSIRHDISPTLTSLTLRSVA